MIRVPEKQKVVLKCSAEDCTFDVVYYLSMEGTHYAEWHNNYVFDVVNDMMDKHEKREHNV